jgi:hypothetical protein
VIIPVGSFEARRALDFPPRVWGQPVRIEISARLAAVRARGWWKDDPGSSYSRMRSLNSSITD